jgi:RNA polymerase sigma factor (sigma-70 family)
MVDDVFSRGAGALPTDQELVSAFLERQPAATETIRGWIRSVVRAGGWRRCEPADLEQCAMARLREVVLAGSFRFESSFQTYVRGVTRITCMEQWRKRKYIDEHEDLSLDPDGFVPSRSTNPEESAIASERLRLLEAVYQRLPEACRQLWRWIFWERQSFRDVALSLGVKEGTARQRAARCMQKATETRYHVERTFGLGALSLKVDASARSR